MRVVELPIHAEQLVRVLRSHVAELLQQRLAECLGAGLQATPVNLPVSQHLAQKSYAVNAYQSQVQMFGEEQLCDLCAPERYWSLSAGESAQR